MSAVAAVFRSCVIDSPGGFPPMFALGLACMAACLATSLFALRWAAAKLKEGAGRARARGEPHGCRWGRGTARPHAGASMGVAPVSAGFVTLNRQRGRGPFPVENDCREPPMSDEKVVHAAPGRTLARAATMVPHAMAADRCGALPTRSAREGM